MGLLRIAAVGALGYFAYRALQHRDGQALAQDDRIGDTDMPGADDDETTGVDADDASDDTAASAAPDPSTGTDRPS